MINLKLKVSAKNRGGGPHRKGDGYENYGIEFEDSKQYLEKYRINKLIIVFLYNSDILLIN